jgi:hypothetical protein
MYKEHALIVQAAAVFGLLSRKEPKNASLLLVLFVFPFSVCLLNKTMEKTRRNNNQQPTTSNQQ